MLRRTMMAALILALASGVAFSQPCVIGVYGDTGGTVVDLTPERDLGAPAQFDVYYVVFAEDFVNGVAFSRSFSGFTGGFGIIGLGVAYGPLVSQGNCAECVDDFGNPWATLVITDMPGTWRVGIGTCKIGFDGVAIPVMRETLLMDKTTSGGTITVGANPFEDPAAPVYNTCINEIKPCNGGSLTVNKPIANDSKTWGSVKALYSN